MTNTINPNSDQCVEFYYFQHEQNQTGLLNIYVKLDSSESAWLVFSLRPDECLSTGGQNLEWKKFQFPLTRLMASGLFQVTFEAYVPPDNSNKPFRFFLDDIFIRDHSCPPPDDCKMGPRFCNSYKSFARISRESKGASKLAEIESRFFPYSTSPKGSFT